MKKYLYRSFILIFLFALTQGGAVLGDEFGRDGVLEIFIQSNKSVYTFGEAIELTLILKNHTTEPLLVNKRFDLFDDLRWEIFLDAEGFLTVKAVPPKKRVADDYVRLVPNGEIKKILPDLSEIVQEKLKKGLYGIRVTYVNQEKPGGPETWTGEIVTNRISLQIRPGEKV